ncbi:hypothetical protein GWI33_001534 [Rhynchophorus ferrugineus]|uniref:Uncharacterized protein n=1 Tax=Rhynchophorus ferrugineus TaxID=354439 RepID=A0A834M104_RHYFE|nr:hypothetical protein GWI33_001534 [Rhynchophorus ferrugineus]
MSVQQSHLNVSLNEPGTSKKRGTRAIGLFKMVMYGRCRCKVLLKFHCLFVHFLASNNANHVPSASSPWCDCFLFDFYLKSLKELKAIPMNRLAEVYNLSQRLS